MNHQVHQVFPQAEDDAASVSSSEDPLPYGIRVPPQLADTPGPFLKSLGIPPRSPASSWSDNPRPSAQEGGAANKKLKSTVSTPEIAKSNKAVALPKKKKKKKTPAADQKKWVPLAFREKKRDDFVYYDTDRFDIED